MKLIEMTIDVSIELEIGAKKKNPKCNLEQNPSPDSAVPSAVGFFPPLTCYGFVHTYSSHSLVSIQHAFDMSAECVNKKLSAKKFDKST